MTTDELRAKVRRCRRMCTDTIRDHPHGNLRWELDMIEVLDAWDAEHPADDAEPADFDWLVSIATQETGDNGEVWWEIGTSLSFTCGSYQNDPGEPVETVATDWMVDGDKLPVMLVPRTRGDVRRLKAILP